MLHSHFIIDAALTREYCAFHFGRQPLPNSCCCLLHYRPENSNKRTTNVKLPLALAVILAPTVGVNVLPMKNSMQEGGLKILECSGGHSMNRRVPIVVVVKVRQDVLAKIQ